MPSKTREKRPNILTCRKCRHEWTDFPPFGGCPECKATGPIIRCGAKTRPAAKHPYCRTPVSADAPIYRCGMHGGESLIGPANPHFVTGEFSRHWLPPKYRQAFEEHYADPHLMAVVRRQVALLLAREEELAARFGTGESGAGWGEVRTQVASMRANLVDLADAVREGEDVLAAEELERFMDSMAQLATLADSGAADEQTWVALYVNMREIRQAVVTEARQVEARRAYMTADEIVGLMTRLAVFVREYIVTELEREPDPVLFSKFLGKLRAMVGESPAAKAHERAVLEDGFTGEAG